MNAPNDFSDDRDVELGQLLERHLSAPDDAWFRARVMARVLAHPRETSWDVLAGWAPFGVAAAVVLALAAGFGLGLTREADSNQMATDRPATEIQLLTSAEPVTNDLLLSVVLEGDGFAQRGEAQ